MTELSAEQTKALKNYQNAAVEFSAVWQIYCNLPIAELDASAILLARLSHLLLALNASFLEFLLAIKMPVQAKPELVN